MLKKSLCLLIAFLLSFQSTVFPFSGVFAQEGGESAPAAESSPQSESTTAPEPAPEPAPEAESEPAPISEPIDPSTEAVPGSPETSSSEQNPESNAENTEPTIAPEPSDSIQVPENTPSSPEPLTPQQLRSSIPEESIIDGTIYETDETKEILPGTSEPSQISESPIISESPLQITQIETIYEPILTSGAIIMGSGALFLGTGEFGTGVDSALGTGELGTGEEKIATMTIMELDITKVIFPENLIISTPDGQEKQPTDLTIIPEEAVTQLPDLAITEVVTNKILENAPLLIEPDQKSNTQTDTLENGASGENLQKTLGAESNIEAIIPDTISNQENPTKEPLESIFEFGIIGEHLLFSSPVTIEHHVPFAEGSLVEVKAFHAGDSDWTTDALSLEGSASCAAGVASTQSFIGKVENGKIIFQTCGASTFSVTYTGGASAPNFVDNTTRNFTGVVMTGVDFPTGSIIQDVNVLVDFRPIDNESPTGPWGVTNCYPGEKSFLLIHPDGTTVQLANAGTYTAPNTTCPQAQILYDQSAASGIVGGAWNLTGQSRQPVGNLSTLNGKSPFGTRTVRLGDNANQDGVVFFGFRIDLQNVECGDGIITAPEVCDDGNTDNSDGCSSMCTLEAGWECTGTPSVCDPIPGPTGLRLHYNGSFAGGTFTDISGNGFNGTQFNGVTTGNQNGETVMCFNGSNQYIERATNLATGYPFTMSTWMKSDTTAGLHGIMSFARSTATNRMYDIEHNGTTIRASAQNTTARLANATSTLNTTERFLVTTVFNSNTNREIYINGVSEGVNTQTATYDTNASKRLNIGRLADSSPSNYFDGCVDDVRFYSTALTSGQIYILYANPATLTTSYTTQSSPLLTGTMQGVLDAITLTISGSTYTGTNNGNGTRTLLSGTISPGLTNGTYPTVLTVTNPYGKAVTYNSSFIVDSCGNNSVDSGEMCDDGNTNNGDGCSDVCSIEPGYSCEGNPSVCDLLTCSSGVYFDVDNSGSQSSGDTLFIGGSGVDTRTGKFDIATGENATIVIDFGWYDDGTTIDVNGTHIYDEGQPNFFTPTLNAPRTVNSNGLPRLRVTLTNGSVLIQGTLDPTSTTLTTLTPTLGSTSPVFHAGLQNEIVVGTTNQGGPGGSDFTVSYTNTCTPPVAGDYCIASPTSLTFPQFTTEAYAQTGFTSSSGYFELIDSNGANSGYYTTLQITSLSGSTTSIPNTSLARQSTGITLLSGTANTGVVLGSAFSSYSVASGTVTFIKRDPAPNSGITGTYGAILDLRIALPAYIKPDTYNGTITYTLYEN